MIFDYVVQTVFFAVILTVEIEVKNRVFNPVFFKSVNRKTCEQISESKKIIFYGRKKKAFSETPGAAQENCGIGMSQIINKACLIRVKFVLFAEFLKILHAKRQLLQFFHDENYSKKNASEAEKS